MQKIVLLNPKGGSGKTTIAINLASYFAVSGLRPTLMDLDAQGSSTRWLSKRAKGHEMATAIVFAVVMSVLFGWLQDRALWAPLRRRGTGLIAAMIVSIGFSIFLRNLFQYFAGAANHNYSQWTSPSPWTIGPVLITPKDVGVIVVTSNRRSGRSRRSGRPCPGRPGRATA